MNQGVGCAAGVVCFLIAEDTAIRVRGISSKTLKTDSKQIQGGTLLPMSDLQTYTDGEVAQSVIVTTIGVLAILAGMYSARESIALSVNGERTTATIVDVVQQDKMYRPVFTFSDKGGSPHVVESSVSTSNSRLSKGQVVPVLYDVGDPRKACIAMWDFMWSIEVASIVVGVLVTGMGVATMMRVTRRGPDAPVE